MMIDMHDDERPRQKHLRRRSRSENEISAAQVSRGIHRRDIGHKGTKHLARILRQVTRPRCPEVGLGILDPTSERPKKSEIKKTQTDLWTPMLVEIIMMMVVTTTTTSITTRVTKTISSTKYVKINWIL